MPAGSGHDRHTALPPACTLKPDDGPARLARWRALNASAALGSRLLDQEFEVRYRATPGVQEELEELAAAEQSCCSFLEWVVSEEHDQPVLRVMAPAESIEGLATIAAMFGAVEAASTSSP